MHLGVFSVFLLPLFFLVYYRLKVSFSHHMWRSSGELVLAFVFLHPLLKLFPKREEKMCNGQMWINLAPHFTSRYEFDFFFSLIYICSKRMKQTPAYFLIFLSFRIHACELPLSVIRWPTIFHFRVLVLSLSHPTFF